MFCKNCGKALSGNNNYFGLGLFGFFVSCHDGGIIARVRRYCMVFLHPQQDCICSPCGAGLHKIVFGLALSARFCSATFLCARETATQFLLSDAKKRHIQPERICNWLAEFVKKRRKCIKII
jgi:hypothetical protein